MGASLNALEIAEYKKLHIENQQKLGEVLEGSTDRLVSKPITHPNASCLIAHCLDNQTRMMHIINVAEARG